MEQFGKYELVRRLGTGGMAEVFLAREQLAAGVSKLLVVKMIHPSLAAAPEFRSMFEDEARIAVNLNHPSIVQTFGYGQIGGVYYLAMEYVEGADLLRVMNAARQAERRIPFGHAAYIVQQIAKGLDYAHRKLDDAGQPLAIVHRDVSPQNVLLSFDGSVKIVDFGIARARGAREENGVVKGKSAYMSPEQAAGLEVDARSDIFSAGIVLYELATDRSLFGGLRGRQAIDAIRNAQVPRLREVCPDVPAALEEIVSRALARRPEDRFQTARDLQTALGHFFFAQGACDGCLYDSGSLAALLAQIGLRHAASSGDQAAPPGASSSVASSVPLTGSAVMPSLVIPPVTNHGRTRERRNVVVIEGALVGMEPLRRALGEVRAREALLDFLRVTENIAYKSRAHPDRLDDRGFTYVLGLPGGSEEDPARAVGFGRALIEALDGISRDLQPPLRLSIGIQRGVALVRFARSAGPQEANQLEYELLGQVGQIAVRLATEALPSEILVGGGIYRAARDEWSFEELPAIELEADGDTAPGVNRRADEEPTPSRSRVYRLLGMTPREPRRLTGPRALFGRDLELRTLDETLSSVVERGHSRTVLVVGERGVGKRTLVRAFAEHLDPTTHLVLRAAGRAIRRDTPYGLLRDLAHDFLGTCEDTDPRELKRLVDTAAGLLASQPGEAGDVESVSETISLLLGLAVRRSDEWEVSEHRHRLARALRQLLTRLSRRRVVLLIFEDLDLADTQSFEQIMTLAHSLLPYRLLVLVTARHDTRIEQLRRDAQVITVVVDELDRRSREELVRSHFESLDDAAVQSLIRTILERAGGNPFYLCETIEALAERGTLARVAESGRLRLARRDASPTVPTTVEATVATRLDRLPEGEREALRAAALLGSRFEAAEVASLLELDDCAATLDRLVARGLLDSQPGAAAGADATNGTTDRPHRYAFGNTITQEVAASTLAPEARVQLHRRAAELLLASPAYRRGADDARLAKHLELAGNTIEAARAHARAGLYARDVSGNTEAFAHLTTALRLLPFELHAERWELHAEREQILRAWGKRSAQQREILSLRRLANALADPHRLGQTLVRLATYYLEAGRNAAAARELARALEAAREADDAVTAAAAHRIEATLLLNAGQYGEALERTRQALAVLDDLHDRPASTERALALLTIGNIQYDQGHGRDAERAFGDALAIYRQLGMRRLEAQALNSLGWVAILLGELEEAVRQHKQALRLCQEIGDRYGLGATLGSIGWIYGLLGDYERAVRYLSKAIALDQACSDMDSLIDATLALGRIHHHAGETVLAAEKLERGLELAQRRRSRYQEIRALTYLAFLRLDGDQPPPAALELARSAIRLARETAVPAGMIYGLAAEALALARMGEPQEAASRSREAIALIDAGTYVDEPEELLLIDARCQLEAGQTEAARAALRRASDEVNTRLERLHEAAWRECYRRSRAQRILSELAQRVAGLTPAQG